MMELLCRSRAQSLELPLDSAIWQNDTNWDSASLEFIAVNFGLLDWLDWLALHLV